MLFSLHVVVLSSSGIKCRESIKDIVCPSHMAMSSQADVQVWRLDAMDFGCNGLVRQLINILICLRLVMHIYFLGQIRHKNGPQLTCGVSPHAFTLYNSGMVSLLLSPSRVSSRTSDH